MPKLFLMLKYLKIIFLFLVWATINSLQAQVGFSHEVGLITGPVAFQSDYGQRRNFETNSGNTGFGIGLIHYLNFSYTEGCPSCIGIKREFFRDHFKIRTELSYSKTNLNHFGQWVTDEKVAKSYDAKQLKSMVGSTAVTDIGVQLEYYPLSIRDFSATQGAFGPFVSLGAHYSFFKPTVSSELGKLDVTTVFPKYWVPSEGNAHGYSNDSGSTISIVTSIGTRYKLNPLSDLILDFRAQYYNSNWVDGLNPNPDIYKENRANDWLLWLNFGYIYYLN